MRRESRRREEEAHCLNWCVLSGAARVVPTGIPHPPRESIPSDPTLFREYKRQLQLEADVRAVNDDGVCASAFIHQHSILQEDVHTYKQYMVDRAQAKLNASRSGKDERAALFRLVASKMETVQVGAKAVESSEQAAAPLHLTLDPQGQLEFSTEGDVLELEGATEAGATEGVAVTQGAATTTAAATAQAAATWARYS